MSLMRTVALCLLGSLLGGCDGKSDNDDTAGDSGQDTALHTGETDDSGETSETAETGGWSSFTGSATYVSTRDGVGRCDLAVTLTGLTNPSYCPDCDFVFDVTSVRSSDDSTAECRASPTLTWLEDYGYSNLVLAFASTFTVDWVDPPAALADALLTGFDFDGGDYFLDDAWAVLGYADDGQSALAWTGADVHWRLASAWSYTYSYTYGLDGCGSGAYSKATAPAVGDPVDAMIAADGSTQDVWTFSGDAGVTVALSIDTVDAASTFAPYAILLGPDGCTLSVAVDNFPCAAPPGPRSCPAFQLTLPDSGVYELRIGSDGWQGGVLGAYTLTTSGISGLTQVEDEVPARYEREVPWTLDVILDAELTPEG